MFNNAQTKVQSQILVGVQFFFSAAVVGLTNQPSVRLSNAGAPLVSPANFFFLVAEKIYQLPVFFPIPVPPWFCGTYWYTSEDKCLNIPTFHPWMGQEVRQ